MTTPQGDPQAGSRARRWRRRALTVLVGLFGCACVGLVILIVVNRVLPAADEATLQRDLGSRLDEARAVWGSLDGVWGRLEAGQPVDCGSVSVSRPYFVSWRENERAAYPSLAALADRLNNAISNLHEAADAWTAVCQSGTAGVASAVVAEARADLSRAAQAINEVSEALAGP